MNPVWDRDDYRDRRYQRRGQDLRYQRRGQDRRYQRRGQDLRYQLREQDRRYQPREPRPMRLRLAGGLAYLPALAGLCALVLALAPVGSPG